MSKKKQTQDDRVLASLKLHGMLDPIDSWNYLGVYRLAASICRLRQQGHTITKETTHKINSWGEPVTVALYKLV